VAKLTPGIEFTGSIGDFSAYKRVDTKGINFRRKGGPSKEKIATAPSCAPVRRNNSEFRALAKAASQVYNVLRPLLIIRDYHLIAEIEKHLHQVKEMDKTAAHGKRNIYLSMAPVTLAGLPLNLRNPFESLVQNPLSFSLSREELRARVDTPALHPGINFHPIDNLPVYRWMISLGVIPDMVYNESTGYKPTGGQHHMTPCVVESQWFHVSEQVAPLTMELAIPFTPSEASFSLMLAAAITFGTVKSGGDINPVKYCGAGKVIAMA
jgi:hypothetical protein